MKGSKIIGIGTALGMLLLILDGKTALSGAREGLEICLQTVIPSLFPFFVLSVLLNGSLWDFPLLKPLGILFRIPAGKESLLISAFLGGYPVGASAVAEVRNAALFSRSETNRMFAFCNQAGPSFIFGIAASRFSSPLAGWQLWGIQIISALLVSFCFPADRQLSARTTEKPPISLPQAMQKALGIMATVCGWVVIFRVVIAFADRWFLWLLPREAQAVATGILELTNGCCALTQVDNEAVRFLLCAGMVSFGGVCVTMQTVSLLERQEIPWYLLGKLLQTVFALALAYLIQPSIWNSIGLAMVSVIPITAILLKFRKSSSNPAFLGV